MTNFPQFPSCRQMGGKGNRGKEGVPLPSPLIILFLGLAKKSTASGKKLILPCLVGPSGTCGFSYSFVCLFSERDSFLHPPRTATAVRKSNKGKLPNSQGKTFLYLPEPNVSSLFLYSSLRGIRCRRPGKKKSFSF